jgi:hypothetical protein
LLLFYFAKLSPGFSIKLPGKFWQHAILAQVRPSLSYSLGRGEMKKIKVEENKCIKTCDILKLLETKYNFLLKNSYMHGVVCQLVSGEWQRH